MSGSRRPRRRTAGTGAEWQRSLFGDEGSVRHAPTGVAGTAAARPGGGPAPTPDPASASAVPGREAPLPVRMRPRTLDEVVGQEHVVGADGVLRRAVAAGRMPSLILWGPPGCGKTTIAVLLAEAVSAHFARLSAVEGGVAELRAVVAEARRRAARGQRTVLFVDELHRWSRSQQDAALPHVESGLLTFIGATTENPSFEVNAALLSRARVFRLRALEDAEVRRLVDAALTDRERGLGALDVDLSDEAAAHLVSVAAGDARVALDALELAALATAPGPDGRRRLSLSAVEEAVQRRALRHDRRGDQHYDTVSAYIKSVRGSDPDAALFWLARMLEAGEDPLFVARRLVILAAEDVGLAEPQALGVAVAAWQAAHFVGMPEGYLPLAEATLFCALAPKSNSVLLAYAAAARDCRDHPGVAVPLHLRNAVTGLMRAEGYGAGYRYAHDAPDHVAAQLHLPPELADRRYYRPGRHGAEAALAARLEWLRARLRGEVAAEDGAPGRRPDEAVPEGTAGRDDARTTATGGGPRSAGSRSGRDADDVLPGGHPPGDDG